MRGRQHTARTPKKLFIPLKTEQFFSRKSSIMGMKPYIVLQVADDYFNFANTMGKTEVIQMNQMKSKRYGYVRVSTKEQNEDRQLLAMQQVGIPIDRIFIDKQSGKDFDRPEYQKLLRVLKEGDLLLVKSIDRLGRDYEEIIEQWRYITKEIKADIKVIDMPLLDTTLSKDLLGTFIADLVLQVLSFAAENERENIKQRQREGIDAAQARGVRFGRPGVKISPEVEHTILKYMQKKLPLQEALRQSGLSQGTFYRTMKAMNL